MPSNLRSAVKALQAELSYSRQGIDYWNARAEALESALYQLEVTEETPLLPQSKRAKGSSPALQHRGRAAKKKQAEAGGAASTQRPRASQQGPLPMTGGEFWLALMTEEPQSAVEILRAAMSRLAIQPEHKVQLQKLRQRVFPALANLVSSQKIQSSGAGRGRRFFKPPANT